MGLDLPSVNSQALPSFERPPLDEVAAGMQFAPMPMKAADVGRFHALLADQYPVSVDAPVLLPAFETFGGAMPSPDAFPLQMFGSPLPRSWFISGDDEHLIQLQSDRLIANWRLRPRQGTYPRFPVIREHFDVAARLFERFCEQAGYSRPQPNQCDLTYFNKIPAEEGWGKLDGLISGIAPAFGSEWTGDLEDIRLSMRKLLFGESRTPIGRLTIDVGPGRDATGNQIWILNLAARGRPEVSTIDAVEAFLELAHVQIVTAFAAVTTASMHKQWGRLT